MPAPLRAGAQAPARDSHRFAPVFLLATARSCSSVVTAMIGQHPALCGLPELKLFASPTIGEMEASLPRFWIERGVTHRSPGLVRALAEHLFGGQDLGALDAAREWLAERRDWPGEAVLDILLARLSPRVAIEKSPENAASDEALARLAEAYPDARYIHLTREPAATQRSMQAHWERVMPDHPLEGQPMLGFAAWVDVNRRVLAFTEGLPAARVLRLRAEDILDGTPGRLRAVASWLGLSRAPAAIAAMGHPEASPFARPGPKASGIIGGYDPGFLEAPVPRKLAPPPPLR
ncbi:MAG TPA: sulfotransferase, partial [Verrucomicrobiae bacterium]|nr:sulfotransferase [Verrucomicrobiae bacterium]